MAGAGIGAEYYQVVVAVAVEDTPAEVLARGSTAWFIQVE
jgi:hypothetical protein